MIMYPGIDKDKWLQTYYAKLQPAYDNSMKKINTVMNWALTVLVGLFSIYFGTSFTSIGTEYKFLITTGFLVVLIQFFTNTVISYSYLTKYRHLQSIIDQYWTSNSITYDQIIKEITKYDIDEYANVNLRSMIKSQLWHGYWIILGAPVGIWVIELQNLDYTLEPNITIITLFLLYVFVSFWSLRKYSKIQKP